MDMVLLWLVYFKKKIPKKILLICMNNFFEKDVDPETSSG